MSVIVGAAIGSATVSFISGLNAERKGRIDGARACYKMCSLALAALSTALIWSQV